MRDATSLGRRVVGVKFPDKSVVNVTLDLALNPVTMCGGVTNMRQKEINKCD